MKNHNSYSLAVNHQPAGARATRVKLALVLPLFALLFVSTFAHADFILFYGGDFEPTNPNANAQSNENDAIVGGSPYGAATYQNFVIPTGQIWNIQSLFTNNLSDLHPTSAYWEIRAGISEGNGGTLIASGTGGGANFTWTATTRSAFGYDEYTAHVTGQSLNLGSGMYWESVVPNSPAESGRSFNTNTFSRPNGVGTQVDNEQYWNSAFFGTNFTNANNEGVFQTFSSGIDGEEVPEPSSLVLVGSGLLGVAGILRRQWSA